jgi:hypothetical protein
VERGIPYARQDFFRGEQFLDVADMQARAVPGAATSQGHAYTARRARSDASCSRRSSRRRCCRSRRSPSIGDVLPSRLTTGAHFGDTKEREMPSAGGSCSAR